MALGYLEAEVQALLASVDSNLVKNNLAGTVAPAVTDDSGAGYSVASHWYDAVAQKMYICWDVTVGAAVWIEVSGGTSEPISWKDSIDDLPTTFPSPVVTGKRYVIDGTEDWTGTPWAGYGDSIAVFDGVDWNFDALEKGDTFFIVPYDTYVIYNGTGMASMNEYFGIGVFEWSSIVPFAVDKIVSDGGVLYKSILSPNTGNTPATSPTYWRDITKAEQKSFSLTVEVAEDGVPAPLATEIYRPVISTAINVYSMIWLVANGAIRVTPIGTITNSCNVGDYVNISGSTNPSNDGRYPIVAVNSGSIDIWNPNRTDGTDDENSSSPAVMDWESKAILRIRRFETVSNAYGYQSCKFQATLPEDYTEGSVIQLKPKFVAPDGGDGSVFTGAGFVRVAVMNDTTGTDGSFETLEWGSDVSVAVSINIGDTAKDKIYTAVSADITMTGARAGSTFFIEFRRTPSSLTKDIGLVEMGVLYV